MALAAISHPRQFLPANRRTAIRPCPSNADHSCPPTSPTVTVNRVARTPPRYPLRSNPHSARGVLAAPPHRPISRFPPLEVFVRRPPECAAPFVSGRHPKTFTFSERLATSTSRLQCIRKRSSCDPAGTSRKPLAGFKLSSNLSASPNAPNQKRTHPMLTGTCHCGTLQWTFDGVPDSATACNCTPCRRYGVLWIYDYEGERIRISGPSAVYTRNDMTKPVLEIHFCGSCGCVICWRGLMLDTDGRRRIAVNLRLTEPTALPTASAAVSSTIVCVSRKRTSCASTPRSRSGSSENISSCLRQGRLRG